MSDNNQHPATEKPKIWVSQDTNIRQLVENDPALFPLWNAHPLFGDFGRRLYGELDSSAGHFTSNPFTVMYKDEPQLIAFCTTGGDALSAFGLPLVLAPRLDMGKKREKAIFAEAFRHLAQLGQKTGVGTARILGGTSEGPLGSVDLACLTQSGNPSTQVNAVVNVAEGEVEVRKNLRDSYRSLVNWGARQLELQYVNISNPDRALFEHYPKFHAEIAGGSVRGDTYWNVFWEEINNGTAELSLGFLEDGSLASGTIVTDAGTTSYYTSGVYDRSKFDKPLGHFPVFDAMNRAGERGIKLFDLGQVYADTADVSEKEQQIGFFKKGFTSSFQMRFIWTVTLKIPSA